MCCLFGLFELLLLNSIEEPLNFVVVVLVVHCVARGVVFILVTAYTGI